MIHPSISTGTRFDFPLTWAVFAQACLSLGRTSSRPGGLGGVAHQRVFRGRASRPYACQNQKNHTIQIKYNQTQLKSTNDTTALQNESQTNPSPHKAPTEFRTPTLQTTQTYSNFNPPTRSTQKTHHAWVKRHKGTAHSWISDCSGEAKSFSSADARSTQMMFRCLRTTVEGFHRNIATPSKVLHAGGHKSPGRARRKNRSKANDWKPDA